MFYGNMATRTASQIDSSDRVRSAIAVVVLHLLLGYVLIIGLGVSVRDTVNDSLVLLDLANESEPPPPPPTSIPAPARDKRPEGAASPPNLRATPTEIVAPTPKIPLFVPPPIAAAPIAGRGAASSAGAADVRGPGTGSGGQGVGTGSGDSGTGAGGGGGGGSPLRWVKGEIGPEDYPRGPLEAGIGGTVGLRFVVGADGRVSDCAVTRSSGNAALDATTCRLIRKRFRYRPKRDSSGRAVADVVTGEHEWRSTRRPDEIIEEPPEELPRQ